jgi:hypothetical protein
MNSKIEDWRKLRGPVYILMSFIFGLSTIGVAFPPKIAWATSVVIAQNGPLPPHVSSTLTNSSLVATPTSGAAPFNVSFSARNLKPASTYSINFGDGTSASLTLSSCIGITAIQGGQGGIICSSSTVHAYISAGTYASTLLQQWVCPTGQSECPAPPPPQTIATVTITVSQM